MQEHVTPLSNEMAEIHLTYATGGNSVNIGLEHSNTVPNLHFIDAIYGGVPSQTKIGQLFAKRMNEMGWDNPTFQTSDAEAEWYNDLGRAVLDSVTGSSADASLWTNLDRPGTNRLIRLLRKARDAAFGRDE